jgi:hypothetical protein
MAARGSDYGLVSIPRLLARLAFGGNPHVCRRGSDTAFQHDLLGFSLLPSAQE